MPLVPAEPVPAPGSALTSEAAAADPTGWLEANQRYMTAAVGALRARLERHAAKQRLPGAPEGRDGCDNGGAARPPLQVSGPETDPHSPAGAAPNAGLGAPPGAANAAPKAPPPALLRLGTTFGLSPFESDLLLLCAAHELDARVAALCAAAHGDAGRPYPTFGLALAVLPEAHWSALTPAAPLRFWQLIQVGAGAAGTPLTGLPLRIDERILHALTGIDQPDHRIALHLEPVHPVASLAPSHAPVAERIAAAWTSAGRGRWEPQAPPSAAGTPARAAAGDTSGLLLIQLAGADGAGKRDISAVACGALGLGVLALAVGAVPVQREDLASFVRLCSREAALTGSALLLEGEELDPADPGRAQAARHLIERTTGVPLLLSTRERWGSIRRTSLTVDVDRPGTHEQRDIWEGALGAAAVGLNGHVGRLVSQFDLGVRAIREVAAEGLAQVAQTPREGLALALWDACRARSRARLEDLAERIEPVSSWEDLVLPEPQRRMLRDIVVHVRQRGTVYETWGFASKGSRGLGMSALFSGASGTGKTMAAEVLAKALRLDLYRIDLSATVSKYIGETEKNLRRIFDAAEEGGAILLFDEADALFGKRSEVKDSHDRYANIEVGYLLQRIEAYRGLAVLTTNLKHSLDTAFLRRIRFIVNFPFPDAAQRAEIWRRVFPHQTPTQGLDAQALARLNVAGGSIRNIALGAAFLAADAEQPVQMRHLLRSAQSEYAKLEKPLTEAETGLWGRV